jgi:glycosyltransferase involved in cell wall biosynthesis
MRIGVDATCWQNNRGYGRYGRSLLKALVSLDADNHYIFFMDSAESLEAVPQQAEIRMVRTSAPAAVAASASGSRSPVDMARMSQAMSTSGSDVLLFPTVYSYVPVISRAKKLLVIHDVIPERYPEHTLPSFRARLFWKAKSAIGRWQSDAIITVSEYSRKGIIEHFKLDPEQVHIVGEASDPVFRVLEKTATSAWLAGLPIPAGSRQIVYVGGFGPHKNLEQLLLVFARLVQQPDLPDLHLVMVGEYRKEVFYTSHDTIEKRIQEYGLQDRVVFTGYLSDEDLVVLLNQATVLALPSLLEGFGLPAVEAAACGCPVVATTASPLPSLLGDGGLYVDPNKSAELEGALAKVLRSGELRAQMRQAGLAATREMSWEKAAQQMKAVIEGVAS